MTSDFIERIGRLLQKSPRYLLRRVGHEASMEVERWLAPIRVRTLTPSALAQRSGFSDVDDWWLSVSMRPPPHPRIHSAEALDSLAPGSTQEILSRAHRANVLEVDLLGSGATKLSDPIDWHVDIKTGRRWEPQFHRDIEYSNLDEPSDVKLPWELSRLQWAIPLGQAWMLTGDDRYALRARQIIEQWVIANPYGWTVNWACTMEPALRILSWVWLFFAFHDAPSWRDSSFRGTLLRTLYLHGDFVSRNLERADINGNHYTANAAGLVYVGLFFSGDETAARWASHGWTILNEEIQRQVCADGVDFEASIAYHRLVTELFTLPAIYRSRLGLHVSHDYRARLLAMARFVAAYSRVDGGVPLVGDADDGRALPLGCQSLNDHRYLIGLIGLMLSDESTLQLSSGPRDEVAWLLGIEAASSLPERATAPNLHSQVFPLGGFYILRHEEHHVFIDCGPLGLAGRGGHGHNDLLSLEIAIDGIPIVCDCGSYVYTASPEERNRFRSTSYHNTPQIDDEEINRFVSPRHLWSLRDDASPAVHLWSTNDYMTVFEGSHDGYARLPSPVTVRRRVTFHHADGRTEVNDMLEGAGVHKARVPWHLAPGVTVLELDRAEPEGRAGLAILCARGRRFQLAWTSPQPWVVCIESGRVSPSYGRAVPTQVVAMYRHGTLSTLDVSIRAIT